VTCLAQNESRLIVGGHFKSIDRYPLDSVTANHIVSWDGSTWQSLGIGLDQEPQGLDNFDGLLVAGGVFRRAGTSFASSVAAWNGSVWEPFGSGVNNQVYAVRSWGEHLFFGGLFSTAGGTPSSCVARLDLNPLSPSSTAFQARRESDGVRLTWQTSGSGRSFQVLRQSEETLVLPYEISPTGSSAEFFDQDAPDTPVHYWLGEIEAGTIVGWLGPAFVPAREFHFAFAPAFPNPFTGTLRFSVQIPKSELATLRVYDIAGREVARLLDGFTPAGEYELSWDGKDRSGSPLAPGIFFVRLDSPSGHHVQKVVKLHP
jgi:hypothetical protein